MSAAAPGQTKARQCGSKRTFGSKSEAKRVIKQTATRMGQWDLGAIQIYKCPWGNHYHFGNRPGAKRGMRQ